MIKFEDLRNAYLEESNFIPIEQLNKRSSVFKYKLFPHLLLKYCEGEEFLDTVRWPTIRSIESSGTKYSIRNSPQNYSYENINYITWIMCWISLYHYQKGNERCVHLNELFNSLPRAKIHRAQRPIVMNAISNTIISIGGSNKEKFELMGYFCHYCRDYLVGEAYMKECARYMICAKKLSLGKEYCTPVRRYESDRPRESLVRTSDNKRFDYKINPTNTGSDFISESKKSVDDIASQVEVFPKDDRSESSKADYETKEGTSVSTSSSLKLLRSWQLQRSV